MNAAPVPDKTLIDSLALTNSDPDLIRLFNDLAPLEMDEELAIGHGAFKRLPEIRDDMAGLKRQIDARLAALNHPTLYNL